MIRIWNSYFTCIRTYKNLLLDLQFKTNSHIGDTYEHFVLYAGIENRYQNLQYLHMWLINWVRYINIQTFLLNKTSSVMLSTYIVKKTSYNLTEFSSIPAWNVLVNKKGLHHLPIESFCFCTSLSKCWVYITTFYQLQVQRLYDSCDACTRGCWLVTRDLFLFNDHFHIFFIYLDLIFFSNICSARSAWALIL